MSIVDFKDSPQVGELKFVRKSEPPDKNAANCEDCADPGTGSENCGCEDF